MQDIPTWPSDYVGLEFKPHGRSREGVDCYGLVWLVYREQFGIELPTYVGEYADPKEHEEVARLIRSQTPLWRKVELSRLGDVLLLDAAGEPAHTGIALWPGVMLHIRRGAGSCIERYDGLAWKSRLVAIYRHPERA